MWDSHHQTKVERDDKSDVKVISKWAKFKLLMWKSWLLQKRRKFKTFIEVLLPTFFAAVLLWVRGVADNEEIKTKMWNSIFIDKFPSGLFPPNYRECQYNISDFVSNATLPTAMLLCSTWRIKYAPDNTLTNKMMAAVETSLDVIAEPYKTEKEIERVMKIDSLERRETISAVIFTNVNHETLPKTVRYKIRMKADQYWSSNKSQSWLTQVHYPEILSLGPRYSTNGDFSPGYFQEGFLTIQRFIDAAIILVAQKNRTIDEIKTVDVQLQKYPFPSYVKNSFFILSISLQPLILVLSFAITFPNIVKEVVLEKEFKLKATMMLMGLPPLLNWIAWFVKYMILLSITAFLLAIFYKLPIGASGAIISKSDGTLLLVLFELYCGSIITLAFFLSAFFSSSRNATGLSAIIFFLSYIPYTLFNNSYSSLGWLTKLAGCILPNVALSFGLRLIGNFEATDGALWTTLATPVTVDDDLTMLNIFFMLIFDIVLYFLLALYVEAILPGEYGISLPVYFPLTKSFWCPKKDKISSEVEAAHQKALSGKDREPCGDCLRPGIKIYGLNKVFSHLKSTKKIAVQDVHLDIYQDQISVLLGHNGAGKSTLLLMLSGFFKPSSGTALINEYDLNKDLKEIRQSLGLCPQHDVFFDHMTLAENLTFFAKLKGCNDMNEVSEMIRQLRLEDLANVISKHLSAGSMRKLCCGIALVGGSKVVILDEPTSGMDPESHRQMWDILQEQRHSRTILLTTQYMDEADFLGDRISIMVDGKIVCSGSYLFLKENFGEGYHIVMVKTPQCDIKQITEIITSYVPTAKMESKIYEKLSFVLPYKEVKAFPEMFSMLENKKKELGITSFSVSMTTIEEVVLKFGNKTTDTGSVHSESETTSGVHVEPESEADTMQEEQKIEIKFPSVILQPYDKLRGYRLFAQQFCGMFKKRVINSIRNPLVFIVQLRIPILFAVLGCEVGNSVLEQAYDIGPLDITLNSYRQPVVFLETQNASGKHMDTLLASIDKYFSDMKTVKLEKTNNITEKVLQISKTNLQKYSQQLIVGLHINGNYKSLHTNASILITGFFNGQPYHSPPHTVNVIGNLLYKFFTNDTEGGMKVTNHPLPRLVTHQSVSSYEAQTERILLIRSNIIFGMSILMATFALFIIKERTVKAKHLQYVSGIKSSLFWLSVFAWDFINFMIPAVVIVVIFKIYDVDGYVAGNNWFYTILLFVICACGVLPFVYALSFLFSLPATGAAYIIMLLVTLDQWLIVIVYLIEVIGFTSTADQIRSIVYVLFPNYSFAESLRSMNLNYESKQICKKLITNLYNEFGFTLEEFCEKNTTFGCCANNCGDTCIRYQESYLSLKPNGIGKMLLFMLFHCFLYFSLVMFLESATARVLWWKVESAMSDLIDHNHGEVEDADVKAERVFIESHDISSLKLQYPTVARSLKKVYGSDVVVQSANFHVKKNDCFGLLGKTGAGKTTIFQMLTGGVLMTHGEVYISGHSVTADIYSVWQNVGYCPQFDQDDALIDIMTVRETFNMYARLRGIPSSKIPEVVNSIMDTLLLSDYAKVKTGQLSDGNRRKVSIGIALMGNPDVVFLDEPFRGMDPFTRRRISKILTEVRDNGRALVLTSHSMEECEILCTNMVFMVNGKFHCLGTPQHLKSKFADGYQFTVKLHRNGDDDELWEKSNNFMDFVEGSISGAILKDYHKGYMTYTTKSNRLTWVEIFKLIEENKECYEIEEFSVGQTTLEQVFLTLARGQRQPRDLENLEVCDKCANLCMCFCSVQNEREQFMNYSGNVLET